MNCKFCGKENIKAGHSARCTKNPKNREKSVDPVTEAATITKPVVPAASPAVKKTKLPEEAATLSHPFGKPQVTSFERPYIDPTTHGKCTECDKKGVFTAAVKLPYFRGRFICPVCGDPDGKGYTYDLFEGK